jgi:DNA (cytosine-5)-methyltransferase 1
MKPIRYLSVCSGMEAASVAWEPLGFKPVGFSEIEPFPCAILKHRFPNTPNYGSLTEYQSWPIEPGAIDLLVGGTPCQSFSVAGLRKGLTDPRGNLALTFLGLADKLKPRWIVWENVPGVLSSGGGRDFGSFLGALVELGYGFAYRVLDAQHFGVPQRRRRVFVVACLGDWRAAAEVLSLAEGLSGYLATRGQKRKGAAADASIGVGADSSNPLMFKIRGGSPVETGEQGGTPGKAAGKGYLGQEDKAFTVATTQDQWLAQAIPINTMAALRPESSDQNRQTFGVGQPGDPQFTISANHCHAVGQPTPFRKSKRAASITDDETWVPADASNTLNNFDLGDTRTTHAIVEPVHMMPSSVAPTVTSSGPPYSRTGNERVEAEALAISFQPGNLRRQAGADPSTTTFPTIKCDAGDQSPHVAIPPMAVRRLTPVECERLQGFPDNWSRISWKGKPEEQCPDGPRYKACGNSMAVPVMRWIGERIAAVDSKLSNPTNNA